MKRNVTAMFALFASSSFAAGLAFQSVIPFIVGILFILAAGYQAGKQTETKKA
ncbi:hypothetical protein [Exiguobacterium aestuarii]|uniref:hypothetical protein n=1 Tax=Exiguobacterium aestuarii TaxID=273527 RepID=UPI001CD595E5|nr:hypothetical protein [Exiguobacterium aestuarii]MCA0982261.1 hypothetical protein [Exiguobacterium aestuarii]